ncbi:MAG: UPF0182 family protein [Candidatus Kuenenia sp.]|nr:UPF0182 family protein [Candidatus Kuenenia hertensis]
MPAAWIKSGGGGYVGGIWGPSNWDVILRYWNGISTNTHDPIVGKDIGFYLFTLPFYDRLYVLLFLLAVVAIVASLASIYVPRMTQNSLEFINLETLPETDEKTKKRLYCPLYTSGAALVFILAWGKYLNRYHLMYSSWGAVTGPGWTDVHIRLPAYHIIIIVTVFFGILLFIPPIRNGIKRFLERENIRKEKAHFCVLLIIGAFIVGTWIVGLGIIPGLFQWLRVEPNEISLEKPYICNNIRFTRQGFGLDKLEEREYPVSGDFTEEIVRTKQNLFSNVRLWDRRALDAVYKQFQEIRLYYQFVDVDDDRYVIGNSYRQVMVSAREMEIANLPMESQTFVNRLFKYTHGNGITLTTVSEFTPDGLPNLLIKDIPPKSEYPELAVEVSQVYYGEITRSHVVVNSSEGEFDYPSGDQNVYIHYTGKGGVRLSNLWRKFLFGWKFDGTRFFLSGYPTRESRIMFHRKVLDRAKILAPFLQFDEDPYIVLANSKLYWIIDAYTSSKYFPYSEPYSSREVIEYKEKERMGKLSASTAWQFEGKNYIRNSVKVVVDAFNGSVDFYLFDQEDPIIRVWNHIFPNLFKTKEEMPVELLKHVRYPKDMLLVQGMKYAKYHMTDPTVFYNQEDLWVRATEKYYGQIQPVEPYYIMWDLPGTVNPEFVLILPFTPKNRQVLIGWIAGMCDMDNYGRFLAYKFPKEKRVIGPQQFETKIDQNRFLSGQLTLWDQRGSSVIRGNVLVIPVDKTLIYAEPIYLQAETAAYPELRLVVVMHGDNFSYGETFDEALHGIFTKPEPMIPSFKDISQEEVSVQALIRRANEAFEDYLRLLGEKRFDEAAQALEILQNTLQQLLK